MPVWRQFPIVGVCDGVSGRLARLLFRGVHPLVPSVHVSCELVEDDDQGQTAACLAFPVVQSSRGGLLVDGLEAVSDLTVKLGVSVKPRLPELPVILLTLSPKPEVQYLLWRAHSV